MDFISTALVTLKAPTGFWETILNAFKSATGTYIMAVILLALIVRIVFSLVDIINKKVNMKNMAINEKMKPELEAIQKKYGHDQRLLQQKQSEIYKKYQFSMMGSCLPMIIMLVLQMTVFLTLWNSLQAVSNYNIAEKYENVKNVYASVIDLNNREELFIESNYTQGDELSIEVDNKNKTLTLKNVTKNLIIGENLPYIEGLTNEDIYSLLTEFVIEPEPVEPPVEGQAEEGEQVPDEEEKVFPEYAPKSYSEELTRLAEEAAAKVYSQTQEGFLWIKNIYKAESPASPLFTKGEIKNYLQAFYSEEEKLDEKEYDFEGKIFDCVVAGMDSKSLGHNGYYILTIIAVVTSILSIWLSNLMMKQKKQPTSEQQANKSPMAGKMMYFIMPLIIGIFTFSYTSLFAIYLIIGQLVMIALTPLTTLIVKKWIEAEGKKKKEKDVIEVDYRRKDK